MTNCEVSFLTDIAKVEQVEAEITQELADACALRIDNARQHAQVELAAVPMKIQEERRNVSLAAKEKAKTQAEELTRDAERREREIGLIAESMGDQVFELLLSKILPSDDEVT
ncbi:hypothetical protein BVX99_02925 [bacterium F16]|nr:hypothetical protein BVX99_02925 [bacterium F16]